MRKNIEAQRRRDGQAEFDLLLDFYRHPPVKTTTDFKGRVHEYPYRGVTSEELAYYLDWGDTIRARRRAINAIPFAKRIAEANGFWIPCGSRGRRYYLTDEADAVRREGDYCAKQEHTWSLKKDRHYAWADQHEPAPATSEVPIPFE
jgi:hypothetical protein